MAEHRHYTDAIALSFFVAEPLYDQGPANWSTGACAMREFDDASSHEEWNDVVEDDDQLTHGTEYPTVQEIVRQSVSFTYAEPRVKPNTLAGLMGAALGSVTTVQDGSVAAYRHALAPSGPLDLPSFAAQIAHMASSQFLYTGLKADSFSLRNNGAYLSFSCPLLGSGSREVSADAFPSAITEAWLRWGDSHVYLLDVTGAPLTLPDPILQGETNLGEAALDVSTRVVRMEVNQPNNLWAEGGYRPSTGVVRGALLTPKRRTDLVLELQVDPDTELDELTWYLTQRSLAFEWQCVGELIALGGTFRFGATVILPRLQLRAIPRHEQEQFDTLELQGRVLDDRVNPPLLAWVYNGQGRYLAPPACQDLRGVTHCWSLDETSGGRQDHIDLTGTYTLASVNGVTAVTPLAGGTGQAAHFTRTSQQALVGTQAPTDFQGAFTLAFWVQLDSLAGPSHQALVTDGNSPSAGDYDFLVLALAGTGQVLVSTQIFSGGGGFLTTTAGLSVGVRTLVMITKDTTTLTVRFNQGIPETASASIQTGTSGAGKFSVGVTGGTSTPQQWLDGTLDTVLVLDHAADAAEQALIWHNGVGLA